MQLLAGRTKANGRQPNFINNEPAPKTQIISEKGARYLIERGRRGAAKSVVGRIVRGPIDAFKVKPHHEADPAKGEGSFFSSSNELSVFVPVPHQEANELIWAHNARNGFFNRKR